MRADLPLARYATDRDAVTRTRPDVLAELAAAPTTRVVLLHRGLVAVDGDALVLTAPAELPHVEWTPEHAAYLGRDEERAYLALVLPEHLGEERDLDGVPVSEDAPLVELASRLTFRHLREVGDALGDRDAGLATTAVALAAWHARHPRCPRCGEPTDVVEAGWARRCAGEEATHYPRTDPAVIMAVTDQEDRLLLGHAAHWPDRRYSTLAGYVEPGESAETAVRREVAEEVGLAVEHVEFVASQPWPFPASLMLGFRARLAPGPVDVAVDGTEITAARLFTRAELAAAVADGEVLLPTRASIARALIEDWFGGPVDGGRPSPPR